MVLSRAHEMTLPGPNGEVTGAPQTNAVSVSVEYFLAPYEREAANRWLLIGDDIDVSGTKITDFALLFHEFATNAANMVPCLCEEGKLDIAVTMKGEIVEIVRRESSGLPQAAPEAHSIGFGSRLEQIIGKGLGVDISREWMPNGLAIRLSIPLGAIR